MKTLSYNNEIWNFLMAYRGYEIYVSQNIETGNYVNHDGTPANDKKPLYYTVCRRAKGLSHNLNIHVANVGGNDGVEGGYNVHQLKYTTDNIDRHIVQRKEYQTERIANHKASRHATYICNNVTINAFTHAGIGGDYSQDRTEIYVNQQPLRNACLSPDFTFEDVLEQVYFNKIAKHNISKYDSPYFKKKYFKNRSIETIDLKVVPVYELLGKVVELDARQFIPYNVSKSSYYNDAPLGFTFKIIEGDEIFVPLNKAKDIKIIGEAISPIVQLTALRHYAQFIE